MKRSKLTASDLDSIIAIEQYTSVSDGMGGNARTWAVLHPRIACKAQAISGQEQPAQGQVQASQVYRFTMRYRVINASTMRIVYMGKRFNIRSPLADTSRDRFLVVEAVEGVANG